MKDEEASSLAIHDGSNNVMVLNTMSETLEFNLPNLSLSKSTKLAIRPNTASSLFLWDGQETLLAVDTTTDLKRLDLNFETIDSSSKPTLLSVKPNHAAALSINSAIVLDTTGTGRLI